MSDFRNQRSRLFVNREIQGRMLGRLAIYWLTYHIILWHGLFLAEWMRQQISAITDGHSVSILSSYSTFVTTQHVLPLVALTMFPLVLYDMLKLSHRFAGPLIQLENRLQDMANGFPPQKVQFRRNDLMTEVQNAFNAYVEMLQSQEAESHAGRDNHVQSDEQHVRLMQQVKVLQETTKPLKKDAAPEIADTEPLDVQAPAS